MEMLSKLRLRIKYPEVSLLPPKNGMHRCPIMISDLFMDVFMLLKINAERGGGQATEWPSVGGFSLS